MKINKKKYDDLIRLALFTCGFLHMIDSDKAQDLANALETAINESKGGVK